MTDRVFVLRSLEQARVLADALRVRILGAYRGEARTTKQLAEYLGEKPGRLYHHVDALEKAGLIRLERTRQVRGTLEKYYRPVADSFKADPALFTSKDSPDESASAVRELITAAFETAAEEVQETVDSQEVDFEKEATITRLHLYGSPRRIEEIHRQVAAILEQCQEELGDSEPADDEQAYGLFLAFYPLAETKKS